MRSQNVYESWAGKYLLESDRCLFEGAASTFAWRMKSPYPTQTQVWCFLAPLDETTTNRIQWRVLLSTKFESCNIFKCTGVFVRYFLSQKTAQQFGFIQTRKLWLRPGSCLEGQCTTGWTPVKCQERHNKVFCWHNFVLKWQFVMKELVFVSVLCWTHMI
jgi:hypothetical protein